MLSWDVPRSICAVKTPIGGIFLVENFPGISRIMWKCSENAPWVMCGPRYHRCHLMNHHTEIMSQYIRNVTKNILIFRFGGHFLQNLQMSRAFLLYYSLVIPNMSPYNTFGSGWNKSHLSIFIINEKSRKSSQVTRYLKSPTELKNRPKIVRDVPKERMIYGFPESRVV